MFQVAPCVIAYLSGKFHENPFIHFIVMLFTDTPAPGWETMKQSSLADYFLCCAWHLLKIYGKSVPPCLHNFTNKHGSRALKNDPGFKRLATIPKQYSGLFLISCITFTTNFMKIRSYVSRNVANRDGFPSKHRDIRPCIQRVKHNTPKFSR